MAAHWIAALGLCIGVAAGVLGAGPSILTVLLLEHVAGLEIGSAIATSLVVVAVMSLVASVPYAMSGAVLWRAAVGFGLASMTGAFLFGHISSSIPPHVLLLIFLMAMMVAAVAMLWQHPPQQAEPRTGRRHMAVLAASGLLIGGVTGLVGLGGGFAVVPLLVVFARVPVRSAVGTSILVIAMNTLAGFAGHLPHPRVDWSIAAYLGVVESVGSLAGVRLGKHIGARALRRAFATTMLAASAFMLGRAVLQ